MTRDETILQFLDYVKKLSDTMCYFKGISDPFLKEDCQSHVIENLILAVDNYDEKFGASLKTWVTNNAKFAVLEFIRQHFRKNPESIEFNEGLDFTDYIDKKTEENIQNYDLIAKLIDFVENHPNRRVSNRSKVLIDYFLERKTQDEIAEERSCTKANVSLIISGIKSDIINNKDFKDSLKK